VSQRGVELRGASRAAGAIVGDDAQARQLVALQVDAVAGELVQQQLLGARDGHAQALHRASVNGAWYV
jgi:hypothetical protein